MKTLRRLAYLSIAIAYIQIVFGAIVRITGSGMGCGDHWPRCLGSWLPDLGNAQTGIELTHRVLGALVGLSIILLYGIAWRQKRAGSDDARRVFRSAQLSVIAVVAVGLLGRSAVKMGLQPYVVVVHLIGAITLLALLATAAVRAGGFGASNNLAGATPGTFRASVAAVGLGFLVLLMGALTANVAGAAGSCGGFPWCRTGMASGPGLHIQLTHRVLAFLLLFHVLGMTMGIVKRGAPTPVKRAAWAAVGLIIIQVLVAAALVEMKLPGGLQSLHQAVGVLVWLAIFIVAMLARKGMRDSA
ncbi:MAG: COX15/CtaA family protein [Gemmatimonadaceae bacterium]|nr:COX15/CtaA family protein [Gemmatimonadaceae bacterium]